ncbi:MAG TPA: hypothetical protein DCY88_04685 [Cyanobacteria bacterium UBA11372]|nr:hypothetical protein [Cyanobacteria bacterium UBA11372]
MEVPRNRVFSFRSYQTPYRCSDAVQSDAGDRLILTFRTLNSHIQDNENQNLWREGERGALLPFPPLD